VSTISIIDNADLSRYETTIDGEQAVLEYRRMGPTLIALVHTGVPASMKGHGVAAALARTALDDARAGGIQVLPFCPYVAAFIRRHPEYQDLVSPRYKGP